MEIENFEKIEKIANYITKKNIIYGSSYLKQTINEILIPPLNENFILIHEICHYLAATPEERNKDNLGLPDHDNPNTKELWIIERELDARDFSYLLFMKWANKYLKKEELMYVEYLCTEIFKSQENYIGYKNNLEKSKIKLQSKLYELNLNLNIINKILD